MILEFRNRLAAISIKVLNFKNVLTVLSLDGVGIYTVHDHVKSILLVVHLNLNNCKYSITI